MHLSSSAAFPTQEICFSTGPLAEIHFPIDSLTKKPKGFAFITYMFSEHAVKAFAEVDGQVFQVHLIYLCTSPPVSLSVEGRPCSEILYQAVKILQLPPW